MKRLAILLLLVLAVACDPGSQTTKPNARIDLGEYQISNRVFGRDLGEGGFYRQKIMTANRDFPVAWAWEFHTSEGGVKSFPHISFGNSPFNVWEKGTDRLPIPLSRIHTLRATHPIHKVEGFGRFNLAFDLWISPDSLAPVNSIEIEVMVWLVDRFDAKREAPVDTVRIAGNDWRYYRRQKEGRKIFAMFILDDADPPPMTPLGEFLDYLVGRGDASLSSYLHQVCFGSEIITGNGGVAIRFFDIQMRERGSAP